MSHLAVLVLMAVVRVQKAVAMDQSPARMAQDQNLVHTIHRTAVAYAVAAPEVMAAAANKPVRLGFTEKNR